MSILRCKPFMNSNAKLRTTYKYSSTSITLCLASIITKLSLLTGRDIMWSFIVSLYFVLGFLH